MIQERYSASDFESTENQLVIAILRTDHSQSTTQKQEKYMLTNKMYFIHAKDLARIFNDNLDYSMEMPNNFNEIHYKLCLLLIIGQIVGESHLNCILENVVNCD